MEGEGAKADGDDGTPPPFRLVLSSGGWSWGFENPLLLRARAVAYSVIHLFYRESRDSLGLPRSR